jgi:hypothetical protein
VTGFVPGHVWAWAAQPGAATYKITFVLDHQPVFQAQTKATHIVLPSTFRFRAGSYRWNVRALPVKPGAAPVVDSTFVLTKATAAAANNS